MTPTTARAPTVPTGVDGGLVPPEEGPQHGHQSEHGADDAGPRGEEGQPRLRMGQVLEDEGQVPEGEQDGADPAQDHPHRAGSTVPCEQVQGHGEQDQEHDDGRDGHLRVDVHHHAYDQEEN